MNNEKYEIYQISVYCDTIFMILKEHKEISIIKLYFYVYSINKERFANKNLYSARNTKDIVSKQISSISGDFKGFVDALPFIIKALYVLCTANQVKVNNGVAQFHEGSYKLVYRNKESKFIASVIEESKSWSDIRFLKEVLHNV